MSDLIDRQFGRLTVIEYAGMHTTPGGTRRKMWKCRCECGKETVVAENNLKNGTTKSCGCWKYEKIKEHNTVHGGSHDRLYRIWKNMKRRCNNPNDSHFDLYGGKGIKVCDEWNDYANFKEWAYANGYDENAEYGDCTIDRIDNNGDYTPSNCRWVNRIVQANNTSKNRYVDFEGKRLTIAEFARVMNIDKNHAWYYVNKFDREFGLPSAQPEQRWIPCSERLPEEEKKTYWVCTDAEYQCECRWTNNRFGIGEGEWGWSIFDTPQYTKPIAWMPLPEPYQAERRAE